MLKKNLIVVLFTLLIGQAMLLNYTVIELYSACLTTAPLTATTATNQTKFSQTTRNFLNEIDDSLDTMMQIIFKNVNVFREVVDVCFDAELLVKTITDVLLDPLYIYQDEIILDNPASKQRIVLSIGAYIPTSMFKLFEQIVSFTNISVLVYSKDINLRQDHRFHKLISPLPNLMVGVLDNIRHFQWNEITVIYIKDNSGEFDEVLYREILDKLQHEDSTGICLKTSIRSPENIASTMNQLEQNNHNQTIIVLGTWQNMKRTFNKETLLRNNFNKKSRTVFYLLDHSWSSLVFPKGTDIVHSTNIRRVYLRQFWNWSSMKSLGIDLNEYEAIVSSYYQMASGLRKSGFSRAIFLAYQQIAHEELLMMWPSKGSTSTSCSSVNCQPGFYRTFGKLGENVTFWDLQIGYMCKSCPFNHYKATVGNELCAKCPSLFLSDKDRITCVDPFREVYLSVFMSVTASCCFFLIAFGGLLALTSLLVFLVKRKTPIVKISDAPVSFVQLALILLTFPLTYFSYFEKPTELKCICRPLLVAVIYNVNISIILVKSHKLVMVFSAKTRISGDEVFKVKLTQIFTVVVNLMVTTSIFVFFAFRDGLPKPKTTLDYVNNAREVSCTGGNQITFLISFMIFVQLACVFQAYRCRRLPDYLSETMNILYASFITTVFYVVSLPIYLLRRTQDGEVVHLTVVLVNSLVILLLMYAKKVYVILFKSHLNTRHYFKKKRLATSFQPRST